MEWYTFYLNFRIELESLEGEQNKSNVYRNIMLEVNSINAKLLFVLLVIVSTALSLIGDYTLVTNDLFFDFFADNLSYERILNIIETSSKWQWINYVILPLIYLLKFFLIASCLSIGTLLFGITISFAYLFRVIIIAEFVFFIPPIIKLFWFGIFHVDYTLQDLQFFSPLSVLSLFDRKTIEPWLLYPLQLLNVFEFAYWLVLAYGLYELTGERYSKMLGLVAASYGTGLLLWVVFIVFLTINLTA